MHTQSVVLMSMGAFIILFENFPCDHFGIELYLHSVSLCILPNTKNRPKHLLGLVKRIGSLYWAMLKYHNFD